MALAHCVNLIPALLQVHHDEAYKEVVSILIKHGRGGAYKCSIPTSFIAFFISLKYCWVFIICIGWRCHFYFLYKEPHARVHTSHHLVSLLKLTSSAEKDNLGRVKKVWLSPFCSIHEPTICLLMFALELNGLPTNHSFQFVGPTTTNYEQKPHSRTALIPFFFPSVFLLVSGRVSIRPRAVYSSRKGRSERDQTSQRQIRWCNGVAIARRPSASKHPSSSPAWTYVGSILFELWYIPTLVIYLLLSSQNKIETPNLLLPPLVNSLCRRFIENPFLYNCYCIKSL